MTARPSGVPAHWPEWMYARFIQDREEFDALLARGQEGIDGSIFYNYTPKELLKTVNKNQAENAEKIKDLTRQLQGLIHEKYSLEYQEQYCKQLIKMNYEKPDLIVNFEIEE